MDLVNVRAARVADELEIEQLDLPSIVKPSLENYYDWLHLTPPGAQLIARVVAASILEPRFPGDANGHVDVPTTCNEASVEGEIVRAST